MSINRRRLVFSPVIMMDYGYHDQHYGIIIQNAGIVDDPNEDLSWVMLNRSGGPEPLPNERVLHKTRGRVSLELSAPSPSQGIPPYSLKCDRGTGYITTQRLIYLPSTPTEQFKSFSTKVLSCSDGHAGSPWIGPSFWEGLVKPVADGNISADYLRISMKMVFYDGGYNDWAIKYENIKERLEEVAQIARETGSTNILNTVHDEQLPEYSAHEGGHGQPQTESSRIQVEQRADQAAQEREANQPLPDEPPPGYDEAQAQAVAMRFDERAREDAERQ